ncbi:bifunctional DNA primase/polymerase, partial [Paracraurococcus lichenis]
MPRDDADGLAPPGAPFAALALRLADLGYSPIPLEGKAAFLKGWQRRLVPDLAWIAAQVSAHPACNVGIVCGQLAGVDIDVLDPDLAYRLDALAVARLGEGPLRIGRWPKRLRVYRLTEPMPKMAAGIKGAAVEVLASGQQFAAYGIHPDTRQPYTWPDGDLTDTPLEDLPEITPAMLHRFMAEAAGLLPRREEAPARARAASAPRGDGEIVRDVTGRVVDGRDAYLSRLAFHAVSDAIQRGELLHEDTLAALVWDRFRDTAELGNAKGRGRPWRARDALRKVRDKLALHAAGQLPGRGGAVETVAPFYPLPTSSAAEARAEVARHVHDFLNRTLTWHPTVKAERSAAEHAGLAVEVAAGKTRIACEALP